MSKSQITVPILIQPESRMQRIDRNQTGAQNRIVPILIQPESRMQPRSHTVICIRSHQFSIVSSNPHPARKPDATRFDRT